MWVAAFFSERKNADEIIRLIELLRELYAEYRRIYLSWDAAPWHRAERLIQYVNAANARALHGAGPAVTILELPTSAQFLNVIRVQCSAASPAEVLHITATT